MNLNNIDESESLILIDGSMVFKSENNAILSNFFWLITRYNKSIYPKNFIALRLSDYLNFDPKVDLLKSLYRLVSESSSLSNSNNFLIEREIAIDFYSYSNEKVSKSSRKIPKTIIDLFDCLDENNWSFSSELEKVMVISAIEKVRQTAIEVEVSFSVIAKDKKATYDSRFDRVMKGQSILNWNSETNKVEIIKNKINH